jgi:uncharacterized protein
MLKKLLLCSLLMTSVYVEAKEAKQQLPHINYVNLPVQINESVSLDIGAQLRIPRNLTEPAPAVILLHSSGGVDSTGQFYAKKFNKHGIVTLEVDMWGGRGLAGGGSDRPSSPHETLADAYTALAYLAQRPDVDPTKIAIMGFSWGGVVSMLTATNQFDSAANLPFKFAAHIAHYPICYGYNQIPGFEFNNLTGAPVLIQSAELDGYDYPGACPVMVSQIPAADQALVEVVQYEGVQHTWDRLEPEIVVEDPFSNLGAGGLVTLSPDTKTAKKSRRKALRFLQSVFSK